MTPEPTRNAMTFLEAVAAMDRGELVTHSGLGRPAREGYEDYDFIGIDRAGRYYYASAGRKLPDDGFTSVISHANFIRNDFIAQDWRVVAVPYALKARLP